VKGPVVAYACRIARENFSAIASENPNFNLEEIIEWLAQHGSGYFLRDESSVFDCRYFEDTVFFEFYIFETSDHEELFRRVVKV
jgi:hypothetical protein